MIALWLVIGIAIGLFFAALLMIRMMRTKMVVRYRCSKPFEETCNTIETIVPQTEGWGFPLPTFDMYQTLVEKNQVPEGIKNIKTFFICNPKLAKKMLCDSPWMAGMMPCSWAVYELENGSVWISKMNIGLMSKMFNGIVRDIMGQVADTDKVFLKQVL